jgi:hypothetical protein
LSEGLDAGSADTAALSMVRRRFSRWRSFHIGYGSRDFSNVGSVRKLMTLSQIVMSAALPALILLASPLLAAEPVKVPRANGNAAPAGKVTIGAVEYVGIPALGDSFKARIDTGATTTSIYAVDVEEFERDGKPWVRFVVKHPEKKKEYRLERPVARVAKIKRRGRDGVIRRPAVELELVIGPIAKRVSVNLADRTGFRFPLLIGRDFLDGSAIVDVSLERTQPVPGEAAGNTGK